MEFVKLADALDGLDQTRGTDRAVQRAWWR